MTKPLSKLAEKHIQMFIGAVGPINVLKVLRSACDKIGEDADEGGNRTLADRWYRACTHIGKAIGAIEGHD